MYVIYSVPNCSFCSKAKDLLTGLEYTEVIYQKKEYITKINEIFYGIATAPQIALNGKLIGSYTALLNHLLSRIP